LAQHALTKMSLGGIHDHLGGGFPHYAVDAAWRIPHFEKMLYDNALLARIYLQAWKAIADPNHLAVVEGTLSFMLAELGNAEGAFYSSLDADSEGMEGLYYTWTAEEVEAALEDPDLRDFFPQAFRLANSPELEGRGVLYRMGTPQDLVLWTELPLEEITDRIGRIETRLRTARSERARPATDDKVIASWNGLALQALAEAARFTGNSSWLNAARECAEFLIENLFAGDRLLRTWRRGRAQHSGLLEDYAALGLGFLALYQTDFQPRWYQISRNLAAGILEHFIDPGGGFFDTPADHETLIARPKSLQDTPIPSGSSLATALLLQLSYLEENPDFQPPAERALSRMAGLAAEHPTAFAAWMNAIDFALAPPIQLALIGEPDEGALQDLAQAADEIYFPNMVRAAAGEYRKDQDPALLRNRTRLDGKPAAYLCRGFTCKRPTASPDELRRLLEAEIQSQVGSF